MNNSAVDETYFEDVIANLRQNRSRIKTAIILLAADRICDVPDTAANLSVHPFDYSEELMNGQLGSSTDVSITPRTEEQRLAALASRVWTSDCLLVYNLDLAISAMEHLERENFWVNLFQNFAVSSTHLLLVMPIEGRHLLPQGASYGEWQSGGRLGCMR